ncbi:hypothetical protein Baya_15069 [Bagarius yarrelli]|uniref:Uncharacterized protein n=1 Tax=Bagarius yarrelli TaxID=175774 RepID=A0A556VAJ8_BAGYA|nr:hypothetical protein Baya_15069 [Bagarius yarrelli]
MGQMVSDVRIKDFFPQLFLKDDRTNSFTCAHQWLYCFDIVLLGGCVMYVKDEVGTIARFCWVKNHYTFQQSRINHKPECNAKLNPEPPVLFWDRSVPTADVMLYSHRWLCNLMPCSPSAQALVV